MLNYTPTAKPTVAPTDTNTGRHHQECAEMLRTLGWREADAEEVYTVIFPNLYPAIEFNAFSDFSHPQPIYMVEYTDEEKQANPPIKKNAADNRMHYHYMFSDTLADDFDTYVRNYGTCLCSGCEYRGNRNTFQNAQRLCALIFDVDSVGTPELRNILEYITYAPDNPRAIPYPSLIVLSGSGLHLYYIFDQPIELFSETQRQLKRLKYALENRIYVYGTTSLKGKIDHLPLNQSFRMVGSINKKHGNTVLAFTDVRDIPKISIDDLNAYVAPNDRVDISKVSNRISKYTKDEARVLFPEWYHRVIEKGMSGTSGTTWNHGDGLYRWWLSQADKAVPGHRYYYFVCLAAYASKSKVPKARFEEDCWKLFPKIAAIRNIDPNTGEEDLLTPKDIQCAIAAYDKDYYRMGINKIEQLSGITIPRRRNRSDTLSRPAAAEAARKKLAEKNNALGKALQGRPSKAVLIVQWQKEHPDGTKNQCIKDLGIDKKTVYKWWSVKTEVTIAK